MVLLKDFHYEFPERLVAQHPLPSRTSSKMMVVDRKTGTWQHSLFVDFIKHLKQGDILVLNDSRVVPARIFGNRSGGKPIEILLVEKITDNAGTEKWRCFTKRVRNYRKGDKLFFGISATATVVGRDNDFLVIEFPSGSRERAVSKHGVPPLPPYIKRGAFEDYTEEDRERYQTVFSTEIGSAAAPTAGLHFTNEFIKKIEAIGVEITYITLHVGADTFAPVREENILDHKMHGETFTVPEKTATTINNAKNNGQRIIAVGTTTVRALESSFVNNKLIAGKSKTDLFITPGYKFKIVDGMLTNFHQPCSTLIILVSAFAGKELIFASYADAIKNEYRLFSYGDCMLIV